MPIGLGTQTGGSTIRPGSFNGIYALKPTWGAISREGQKLYSLIFDVLGLYARSAADLDLLAEVFDLQDDEVSPFSGLKGARFAICKTPMWSEVGEGTKNAMDKGASLLRAHGATVEELTLPPVFDNVTPWHKIVLGSDGHPAFLADYRTSKDQLSPFLQGHVERSGGWTRKQQLEAFDGIAKLRPEMDEILGQWDAIIVPSVPDEAPEGLDSTGSAVFNSMWTVRHFYFMVYQRTATNHRSRLCTLPLSTFQASRELTICRSVYPWSHLGTTIDICSRSAELWVRYSRLKVAGTQHIKYTRK